MKRSLSLFVCILFLALISFRASGQNQLVRVGQTNGGGQAFSPNYQLRESSIGVTVEGRLIKSPSYQIGGYHVKSLPWPIDRERSVVKLEPGEVVADGVSSAKITVDLTDLSGDPLRGKQVVITTTPQSDKIEIIPQAKDTDEQGRMIAEIKSTQAVEVSINVSVQPDNIVLSSRPILKFSLTPSFSLSPSPQNANLIKHITEGKPVIFEITVLGQGGFSSPINLTVNKLPQGAQGEINPKTLILTLIFRVN